MAEPVSQTEEEHDVPFDVSHFLALSPASPQLAVLLSALASTVPAPSTSRYPDALYMNYYPLGLSLLFRPQLGYVLPLAPDAPYDAAQLVCDGVDVYNALGVAVEAPPAAVGPGRARPAKRKPSPFSQFPRPLLLSSPSSTDDAPAFVATPETAGKEFIVALGEPDRKGGGEAGGMGVWMEWTPRGIMAELNSEGLGAWEKGGASRWRTLTVFPPATSGGSGGKTTTEVAKG